MDPFAQYTKEQMITALQSEYEYLLHDDYDPDEDRSPEDNLEWLNSLSRDELKEEVLEMVSADNQNQDLGDSVSIEDYFGRWLP